MRYTTKMTLTLIAGTVLIVLAWATTFGYLFDIFFLPWWGAIIREVGYIIGLLMFGASIVYGYEDDEYEEKEIV